MAAATCSAATVAVVAAPSSSFVQKSAVSQRVASFAPRQCAKLVANRSRIVMSAEKAQNVALPATLALLAAAVLPEIAEAAQPGVSPSLQNLIGSVIAGGVVLGGIGIAVAGVSTFDPVKRK